MQTHSELILTLRGNEDPDAMVLLQMAEAGSDLRKPHELEFVFDVREKVNAEAIAKELNELNYDVRLYSPDLENTEYQVIASRSMVLDLSVLNQLSKQFQALAEKYESSYDGWGAEIVE